jgi:hypothetical protein
MKKILQLCLAIVLTCSSAFAQEVKNVASQQTVPPSAPKVIRFEPGTSKHLPLLFTVATKTVLFLNIADEIGLSQQQKEALGEIHKNLQSQVMELKTNYEQENEKLQVLLNSDQIELDNMRENLRASEQVKAEMQYYLFEALLKATKILTPEQKQKILAKVQLDDVK